MEDHPGPPVRGLMLVAVWLFSLLLGSSGRAAQPYGLERPAPVAPFLDGALPATEPRGPLGWDVVDAFPNLPALPTVLVIASSPADERLYVGTREGEIVSFENDAAVSASEPFMDLRDRVAVVADGGLLGMIFHPDFGRAGSPHELTFYAYYSSFCPSGAGGAGVDLGACHRDYPRVATTGFFGTWLRLSRFQAVWDPAARLYRGDRASEEPMLNLRLYNSSHRGGGLAFGSDGRLYLTIGDQFRYVTAQEITSNLEGGSLRLAVDVTEHADGSWSCPGGSHPPRRRFPEVSGNPDELSGRLYCIPDDNPWLDPAGSVFEEYFTIGHRNPHRLAFDAVTGLLWSAEVGENTREEINVLQAGGNYGWPFREGLVAGPLAAPASVLGVLSDPVTDFSREEARAIIGGYVYRGSRFPELVGRFLAGDWFTRNLWAVDLEPGSMTATKELLTSFDPGGLATFGQDHQGEIVMGSVWPEVPLQRLERTGNGVLDPASRLSELGAFADLARLDPHPAAVPYDLIPFWSDGARRRRWLFLPNDGSHDRPQEQVVFSPSGNWSFPVGTVLMKHFELPVDEGDPDASVRLETRFLVRAEDGAWYGLGYRWLPDQSDARLLTSAETGDYAIRTSDGSSRTQTWSFPSRDECLRCHDPGAGGAAGPRTHQLNRLFTYPSTRIADNQLRTWNHLGMFSPALREADIPGYLAGRAAEDARASLELRARSYLDANCSFCHRAGSGDRGFFDARLTTPLESQGLLWGGVLDPLGIPDAYLVKPGDPLASILYQRAAALGPIAMPPLAKHRVDAEGVALLADWILRAHAPLARRGVRYDYYEVSGLSALPDFERLTPVASGVTGDFDLAARQREDNFAFRFETLLEVPASGAWTFSTRSDDGSQLFVDGVLVVDNDGRHGALERFGTLQLAAGLHELVVTMFERIGPQLLSVSWQGPGVAWQQIPAGSLFQEVPEPRTNEPPVLSRPPSQSSRAGETVSLTLSAWDPDGDPLYYSASDLPPGLSIDAASGRISGTLAPRSVGFHGVTASASDGPEVSVAVFLWSVEPCDGGADTGDGDGLPDACDPTPVAEPGAALLRITALLALMGCGRRRARLARAAPAQSIATR